MSEKKGMVTFYCDGLIEPRNPGGFACWGWIALSDSSNQIATDCGCVGHGDGMTNNIAEYWAFINAATWALMHHPDKPVTYRTDSKLVVEQVNGRWKVNSDQLRPLADLARHLLTETGGILEWVPREQNTIADALSRRAYRRATGQK